MNNLLYFITFTLATVLIFFIAFIVLIKAYSKISKGSIVSLAHYKRVVILFALFSTSIFVAYHGLYFIGVSPKVLFKSDDQSTFSENDPELARVEKFLGNYENLSFKEIQDEMPYLKHGFYLLKSRLDEYDRRIAIATKEYNQKKTEAKTASETADTMKTVTQEQFNAVASQYLRISEEERQQGRIEGIVLSIVIGIITSLVGTIIYTRMTTRTS